MKETWKSIKNYDGKYWVSNTGKVKSARKILKNTNDGRYYRIILYKNGKGVNKYVHRLVAEAFVSRQKNKKEVNHKDGDKLNNNHNNLEWVTPKENTNHSIKKGLRKYIGLKLSVEKATEILNLLNKKVLQKTICEKYNISQSLVSAIKTKKVWKHIHNQDIRKKIK